MFLIHIKKISRIHLTCLYHPVRLAPVGLPPEVLYIGSIDMIYWEGLTGEWHRITYQWDIIHKDLEGKKFGNHSIPLQFRCCDYDTFFISNWGQTHAESYNLTLAFHWWRSKVSRNSFLLLELLGWIQLDVGIEERWPHVMESYDAGREYVVSVVDSLMRFLST